MIKVDIEEVNTDIEVCLKSAIYFKEKAKEEKNLCSQYYFDGQINILNRIKETIAENTYV